MQMKKVVLLGDSIRLIGYGKHVAEFLGRDYDVWQPSENSRFASFMLRQVFDHRDRIAGADAVHFNAGLWDVCDLFGDGPFTPKEEYVATLLRAVSVLKQQGAGTLIFATTTPAGPGKKDHSIDRTAEYNRAAVEALKREGVIINDLFGLVSSDIGAYIRPDDMLHLTATAEIVCAKQTADIIASSITAAAGKRTPGSGNR